MPLLNCPPPLILQWVNPGGKLADGWTVGLAEISWSFPPAPFAGPAHQLTSDYLGFEKNTHGQLLSLLLQLLQLQVNVSASDSHFLGPGLPQLGWKRGKQWFLGQRCPTMLRLLSQSFNLKTSALLCSVSPPSWLHFYYCVIINTFISLCFLWGGEASSTKSKEIYSHTKRLFFQHSHMKTKLEEFISSWTWIKSTYIQKESLGWAMNELILYSYCYEETIGVQSNPEIGAASLAASLSAYQLCASASWSLAEISSSPNMCSSTAVLRYLADTYHNTRLRDTVYPFSYWWIIFILSFLNLHTIYYVCNREI